MKKGALQGLFFLVFLGFSGDLYAASKNVTIYSKASVPNTLELALSQNGQSELRFGSVPSTSSPSVLGPLIIHLNITSNTGERYQVTQQLSGPLRNLDGNQIGVENLKFKSSSSKAVGTVVSTPVSASASVQTVYVSDGLGSSDHLSIEYTLTAPPNQAPGDYSAPLNYTVAAL